MQAYYSGTDQEHFVESTENTLWFISLVVNNKNEWFCKLGTRIKTIEPAREAIIEVQHGINKGQRFKQTFKEKITEVVYEFKMDIQFEAGFDKTLLNDRIKELRAKKAPVFNHTTFNNQGTAGTQYWNAQQQMDLWDKKTNNFNAKVTKKSGNTSPLKVSYSPSDIKLFLEEFTAESYNSEMYRFALEQANNDSKVVLKANFMDAVYTLDCKFHKNNKHSLVNSFRNNLKHSVGHKKDRLINNLVSLYSEYYDEQVKELSFQKI